MRIKVLGLASVAAMMAAIPALAHHSFAMFDAGQVDDPGGPPSRNSNGRIHMPGFC